MLNDQEGKTLRFIVCRAEPVRPEECVVLIPWSDLPRTTLVARAVLNRLEDWGYVRRDGRGFIATVQGEQLITKADKRGMWRAAPSPEVTNRNHRR